MKGSVISVVSGLVTLGLILSFVVPCAGCSSSPFVLSQEDSGKSTTELTMDSADINPDAIIIRTYTWEYGGKEWTWELQIPEELYHYYREVPRLSTNNYSVYVTHPLDDEYIGRLATTIKEAADDNGYNQYETMCLAASFVQNLPYNADSETTPYDEYPRYPVETLVDDGGDCEDTSVLLASLLYSMGHGVVLVNPPDHLAIGIRRPKCVHGRYYPYKGDNYYYLETTSPAWLIGELPHNYRFDPAYIYGIEPVPILNHSWTTQVLDGSVILDVTVRNLGAIAAEDICVWAGFETVEEQWLSATTSDYFTIASDSSGTVRLTLGIPSDKRLRLLVQIIDDGYAVDSSQSYWLDG